MSGATSIYPGVIPDGGQNNRWYQHSESNTVFVFVHGIFSDSRGCWLHAGKSDHLTGTNGSDIYWPRLIAEDARFSQVDIFLAGYHTHLSAGSFGLQDAAHELYEELAFARDPSSTPVLARKNIVFIAHSTGGIVVRYLLTRNYKEFGDKNVGVVLMASPSTGAIYANRLKWLNKAYKLELGRVLQIGNMLSEDLDRQFSSMVLERTRYIPNLKGAEACEHQIILRKELLGGLYRWLPPLTRHLVVDPESAGRYFKPAVRIYDSDHFSIVKPSSIEHDSHKFLYHFWVRFGEEFLGEPNRRSKLVTPALGPQPPTTQVIGREAMLSQAKQILLENRPLALYGPAQAGKTMIASVLANDAEVRARFPDGVLWASMAEANRDASGIFALWADALGLPHSSVSQLKLVEDRARAVANQVASRKVVVVCEDCTSTETAVLLKIIGTSGARLLTTESSEVANAFAGVSGTVAVGPLADKDARALLTSIAPLKGTSKEARAILRRTEGLPGHIVRVAQLIAGAKDPRIRNQLITAFGGRG